MGSKNYTSLDPGWKICLDCKEKKTITMFSKNKTGTQGVQARCRDCAKKRAAEWRLLHPFYSAQRAAAGYYHSMKWQRMFQRYGLTKEQFLELEAKQNGRCAICEKERRLVVDHCHTTGKVRGLLCTGCNTGLGHIEKESWLKRATAYLSRHGV